MRRLVDSDPIAQLLASPLLLHAVRIPFHGGRTDPVGRIEESVETMAEFLSNYGLWIVLGGIFVAMHLFGRGCCGGGHDHGQKPKGERDDESASPDTATPTTVGPTPTRSRPGGCH